MKIGDSPLFLEVGGPVEDDGDLILLLLAFGGERIDQKALAVGGQPYCIAGLSDGGRVSKSGLTAPTSKLEPLPFTAATINLLSRVR